MKLMPDEKLVLESDNKNLILTTHRIRFIQKLGWGNTQITSIMLENLDACMSRHIGKKYLIILAALSLIVGLAVAILVKQERQLFLIGLIISIIFYGVYFITRKGVVTLYAGNATMDIQVKGMGVDKITDFINEIEKTKDNRDYNLFGKLN